MSQCQRRTDGKHSHPGGASNALVDTTTMYVVGQQPQSIQGQTLFGGNLTVRQSCQQHRRQPHRHQRRPAGRVSRMIEADDNTLWIGMTGCTAGVRYATNPADGYGCLTMYNTSTKRWSCLSRTSATQPGLPR